MRFWSLGCHGMLSVAEAIDWPVMLVLRTVRSFLCALASDSILKLLCSCCIVVTWLSHGTRPPSWAPPAMEDQVAYTDVSYFGYSALACSLRLLSITAQAVWVQRYLGGIPHTGWLPFVHPSLFFVFYPTATPLQA